jgi:O-antigen/teichoic acid export membrane protein
MRDKYQQGPLLPRRALADIANEASQANTARSADQTHRHETPDQDEQDIQDQDTLVMPILKEMGLFLDTNPIATGPLISIDQFTAGPLLNFDQLETAMLPAIPSLRQSADARDADAEIDPADMATIRTPAIQAQPISPEEERVWEQSTIQLSAATPKLENYREVANKLIKSSGLYAIASLGGPAISLALTPFLAHNLTPSAYGEFAILVTVISLTAGVTQLGLGAAFFRAYNYDYTSDQDRRSVIASVSLLLGLITLAVTLCAMFFSSALSVLIFRQSGQGYLISLAAIAVLAQNLTIPGFAWLRAENRALFFSLLSMVNILLNFGANIVLVGVLGMGVAGAILAIIIGYAAVVVLITPPLVIVSRLRVRTTILWNVLSFGAPQVLSVISVWVLQLSDRYLLEIFGKLAEVASYSIAYSLGSTLSTLILAPFSLAWPTAMYTIAKRKDAPLVFQKVFRWFSMLLLFSAFGLSLVSNVAFRLLFPATYQSAAPVIPVVAESLAFYGIYTIVMIGSNVRRKTWMISAFTTIAAVVNFGFNLLLIPRYGAMGAAFSTLIAYVALAVIAYVANQRIYPIPFEVGRLFLACIAGVAIYFEIFSLPAYFGVSWTWPLAGFGLVFYGGLLVLMAKSAAASQGQVRPADAV